MDANATAPETPRWLRWLSIADVIGIAVLVPAFIWRLQFLWPHSWVIFPVWLGLSFMLHRDTPKSLGWRGDNLWPATKSAAVVFAAFILVLVTVAWPLHAWGSHPLPPISFRRLWSYFAFCLLQQVALQSFLNNRLLSLVPNRLLSSAIAGLIFGLCHLPNPVLIPVTAVGGAFTAWLFARNRNIIPLAIGQALLGTFLWLLFPVEWHHRMRVGPGYYEFRP